MNEVNRIPPEYYKPPPLSTVPSTWKEQF